MSIRCRLDGGILLNLSRLNHILALQSNNQTAVVEACVLNGELDKEARVKLVTSTHQTRFPSTTYST
ncbi:FAD-binding protein [Weissella confusa]|uniref:FAD-binding protein n=1 Tax=Weissella confusa TaxID=1583 RepID=UPI0035C971FE|nr:FAD-binding oxidoreductase [Weissella confusa]